MINTHNHPGAPYCVYSFLRNCSHVGMRPLFLKEHIQHLLCELATHWTLPTEPHGALPAALPGSY